jgi:hypothetical protein
VKFSFVLEDLCAEVTGHSNVERAAFARYDVREVDPLFHDERLCGKFVAGKEKKDFPKRRSRSFDSAEVRFAQDDRVWR